MAGIKSLARKVQSKGRGRDRILAHINEDEARLLKARGGSGARNPHTGLLEFDDGDGDGGDGAGAGDGDGGGGGAGDGGGGDGGGDANGFGGDGYGGSDPSTDPGGSGVGGYGDGTGGGDNGGGGTGGGGDTYLYPVGDYYGVSALSQDPDYLRSIATPAPVAPTAAAPDPAAAPPRPRVVTTPAAVLGQSGGAPSQVSGHRQNYFAYNKATPIEFGANYQAPTPTSGVQGAVNAAYQANVGRNADAGESQYWNNYQRITGAGPGQMQQQMGTATAGEAETRQLQGTVSSQYENIFGRSPDQEGLNYWTQQLRSGAVDGNTMGGAMANAAGQSDQVRMAYMRELGRAPDQQGLAYWQEQMQSGAVPADRLRAALAGAVQPGTRDAAYQEDPGSVRPTASVPAYFAPRAPQPMRQAMAAGGLATLPPADRYARRLKR